MTNNTTFLNSKYCVQVPLLFGSAGLGILRAIKGRRKASRPKDLEDGSISQNVSKVNLDFEHVHCSIVNKKGEEKVILQNVSGEAKAGR